MVEVVPREGAALETCKDCGRTIDLSVGPELGEPEAPGAFEMSLPEPKPSPAWSIPGQPLEAVERQIDGLVANTMRSVAALEGRLTSNERDRILLAVENAVRDRKGADLDSLGLRLVKMEEAARLIGDAMLRP